MLDNKIGKVCIIVLWYIVFLLIKLFFPSSASDAGTMLFHIALSVFLTLLIKAQYFYIRKRIVKVKVRHYLKNNDYNTCQHYLDKCLWKQPHLWWLKFEKLFALGLQGNITDYQHNWQYLRRQPISKRYHRDIETAKCFNTLFQYLTDKPISDCNSCSKQYSYLNQSIKLLTALETADAEEIIVNATALYEAPYAFYKSFSSVILAEAYRRLNDNHHAQLYQCKAIKNAPSVEILQCVIEHFSNVPKS